ncbi:FxSxx-COOH system tetratricopeptide repeat protein [Streptomyces spectabilis]|uniref:Tetratricopeptide (TPR) repeat protein n=1 Tax=Streptomyces spectabilis TaxID=68270 RepID=A0A5P2XEN1_STRST|nr:FxSxx-COOH system tetratricopeptide repeat protein [Streptomyces spectabilis]MBB5108082.1 tetratricopeptide (TPR) repeat protein [Streptomyces spectabilis]MCI3904308.1 FxSxx-COOH system tetratricopeptide repeat protein [Streptomyces spectabilis]QEV61420.1 tetratricopeptide repeat protein [Streptomyces spectabilis]GGV26413.1 cytochrome c [Streptomyces spectabilis]
MTAASAEPSAQAARESARAGQDPDTPNPEAPTWTELADALYLAACQDAALPEFPPLPAARGTAGSARPVRPARPDEPPAPPRRSAPDLANGPPDGHDEHPGQRPEEVHEKAPPLAAAPVRPLGPLVGLRGGVGGGAAGAERTPRPEDTAPLADSLALGRALRPLRLSRPSPHDVELDEEATAEQAAADGLWTPVCRSLPERHQDLLLLVDDGPSMALWRGTTRRIGALMEQTAAFRTVRRVRWSPRGAAPPAPSTGTRQLVLVVTDGGHDAWRDGAAAALLHRLARSSPTAVLNVLPQHLWDLTLPTVTPTRLRAASPAEPNRRYDAETCPPEADALAPRAVPEPGPADAVAVPVVELRAESLGRWARLVAAADTSEWHRIAALLTAPAGDLRAEAVGPVPSRLAEALLEGADEAGQEPQERDRAARAAAVVRRFRATASPAAFALAKRLAAVPLNLPVMRLLQQALPGTRFWNLAEIVLLGLVRRGDDATDVEDAHQVSYDFVEGVREELLALGRRADTIGALRQVEGYLGPRLEALWEGGGALVAPDGDPADPPITDQTRPFVTHLYTALCALSGPYLARADHLGRLLQSHAAGPRALTRDEAFTSGHKPSLQYSQADSGSNLKKSHQTAIRYRPQAPANTPDRPGLSSSPPSQAAPSTATPPTPPPSPSAPPRSLPGGPAVSAGLPVAPGPRGPHDPPRIWGNVPQRNRNFTGREALLEQLQDRLGTGVTAVLPEALHGMGGVGKSQIAVEYVYRHSRDYRLIWWVASEQENQIVQSLIELGEQMGLQAGSEISAVPAVLDALRRGEPYSDWLLVFDNAEDPKEVRKYFPSDGPGRILVTSRNVQWSHTASSLEVDVFAREESVSLLRRRSPELPDEAVNHLASSLGDLPLAVEQASVWLAETGMPVQQYLELFERKWAELLRSDPPPDYEMPVAAAWNVSLERLREDRPDALQLLQVCAFFAPEPISWDLFSAVRGISVPQELQAALDDPVKLGRAVREIGRYALARIDHRQSTVQLHRLVQRVLVEQMNPQEQAQMRHAAHQLLSNADPRNPQRATFWPRYSSLLTHLRASNAVECEEGWTRRLVLNEVWFLRARGDYAAALNLGERAAEIWRGRLGEDHEEVLAIDQQIAETLREQNLDLERAFHMQAELVDRYRRVLGNAHENTLQAQSFMAGNHRIRGNFYEASEIDQRVYETSLAEFGPDDPATLLTAHNYAVSLRLAGSPEKARELDHDTWQRRVEVLGEDHLYTLTTYNAYLLDLQEVGRYEEALEGYEQLAEDLREQLGGDHWFTVQVVRNLCVTRRKKGDHEGAYELSTPYISLVRGRFGERSRQYLQMAISHANDLRQVGKLQEARQLTEQALAAHRGLYGREHPHSHAMAMNLAVTLRLLGENDGALALNQEIVDGLTRTLSAEHPRTLLARMNLASDHFALGRPDQAYEIDAAVAQEAARLRERHPANLAVQLNLSHDLKALGRTEESGHLLEEALSTYRTILGPSHPATRDAEKGLRANADIDLISL